MYTIAIFEAGVSKSFLQGCLYVLEPMSVTEGHKMGFGLC